MLKKTNQKGFSIIEVLIVLAIAGLIMLIVFLAVPALQRNSRNQARQSEASVFATSVNDCITNNNGKTANCNALGANAVNFDSTTQANQLTTAPVYPAAAPVGSLTTINWKFGYVCNGSTPTADATKPRAFVVTYQTEGSSANSQACLQS